MTQRERRYGAEGLRAELNSNRLIYAVTVRLPDGTEHEVKDVVYKSERMSYEERLVLVVCDERWSRP